MYTYQDLDRHFTFPKQWGIKKIPRKLKKKVKAHNGCHYIGNSDGARFWFYLEYSNPDYKRFLIKKITEPYL